MSLMLAGAAAWRRPVGGGVDPVAASIYAKLASWWEMNEASGTRADSKGGNNLAVVGTVTTATGARETDTAAAFSGTGHLSVNSNSSVQVPAGGGDHCVFGWAYINANSGAQFFVAKWGAGGPNNLEYAISLQSGVIYGQNGGSAYYNASQAVPTAGAWHFYVLWRDSADGKPRLQIDNGAVNVAGSASNPPPSTVPLSFGAVSGSFPLSGRLQRWGWMKGAILSADERAWLYNAGAGRTWAELAAAAGR